MKPTKENTELCLRSGTEGNPFIWKKSLRTLPRKAVGPKEHLEVMRFDRSEGLGVRANFSEAVE